MLGKSLFRQTASLCPRLNTLALREQKYLEDAGGRKGRIPVQVEFLLGPKVPEGDAQHARHRSAVFFRDPLDGLGNLLRDVVMGHRFSLFSVVGSKRIVSRQPLQNQHGRTCGEIYFEKDGIGKQKT